MKLATSRTAHIVSVAALLVGFVLLLLVVLSLSGTISLCGKKERRGGKAAGSGTSATPSSAKPPQGKPAAAAKPAPPRPGAPSSPANANSPGAPRSPAAKSAAQPPVNAATASQLIDMEGPAAAALVREQGRDKVLYVLGQMGCPACQACKKYLKENNHGDVTVFVDLAQHGDMMTDGSLPKPVTSSLGRGVPCLVAFSHRAGAVMKKNEGFSPKAVEEMTNMVKA